MQSNRSHTDSGDTFSFFTRMMAGACHGCPMCGAADRNPRSRIGRAMRWQRSWCPGWKARSRVYGDESIQADPPNSQTGWDPFEDLD